MRLNPHGALLALGVAVRRGRTLSVAFPDRGPGELVGTMGTAPQLQQRQTKGSDSPICHVGAATHPDPCLETEHNEDVAEQSVWLKGQVHPHNAWESSQVPMQTRS